MSLKLYDLDIEKYILAGCLNGPEQWSNIPENWLTDPIHRRAYREFKEFLKPPYTTYPTFSIMLDKVEDPELKVFIADLQMIKTEHREIKIRQQDLFEMYSARKLLEVAQSISNDIEKKKIEDIVRSKITDLVDLMNPLGVGQRKREFIYKEAKERWEKYELAEKGIFDDPAIPYCISELDKLTNGGMRKGDIVLIFADTSGYKTKFMANIAYNFTFIDGVTTAVATLEEPFRNYARIIDSRNSLLSYDEIQSGELLENRVKYKKSLIDQVLNKPPLYLIDIPDKATSVDMINELELFNAQHGKYPDVLVIDYANEMEPITPWNNTSEKFKNLGVELRRIARTYNVGIITGMQGNRKGKEMKDKERRGLEHIGESHYFSNVCQLVISLYQDDDGIDASINQLNFGIKKNRYGRKDVNFSVYADPVRNYIGDRSLIYPDERKIIVTS